MFDMKEESGSSSHGEYEDYDRGQVSLSHIGNLISPMLQDPGQSGVLDSHMWG